MQSTQDTYLIDCISYAQGSWLSVFEMHLNNVHIICDLLITFHMQLFMLNVIFFKVVEFFFDKMKILKSKFY